MERQLVLRRLCRVRQPNELFVGAIEEQLQVLQRRGVSVLQADEQPLLDDSELVRPLRQLLV